jgi:hypothetical protein
MGRPTNHGQLQRTLRELRRIGRLEPVDAAAVQAVNAMAFALDADPGNAALWRQYREALRELTSDDDAGGSFDEAVAALSAEVGDAPQA